jgi:hypothetical protein
VTSAACTAGLEVRLSAFGILCFFFFEMHHLSSYGETPLASPPKIKFEEVRQIGLQDLSSYGADFYWPSGFWKKPYRSIINFFQLDAAIILG